MGTHTSWSYICSVIPFKWCIKIHHWKSVYCRWWSEHSRHPHLVISLDLLTSLYTYTPKNHWLRTMRKTSWSTLIWCSRLSTLEEFEVFQTFWMVPDILSANLRQDAEHSLVERLAYLLSVLCHSFGPWTWCATLYCCTISVASRQCLKNLNLICSCTTRKVIANTKLSWKCERWIVWQICLELESNSATTIPKSNATVTSLFSCPNLHKLPEVASEAATACSNCDHPRGGLSFHLEWRAFFWTSPQFGRILQLRRRFEAASETLAHNHDMLLKHWGCRQTKKPPKQRHISTIRTCYLNSHVDRSRSNRNNRHTWPQAHHHHKILTLRAKHPRRKYCVSKVQLEMAKMFHPLKGIKRDVNARFACYQQDWIGGLNSGYRYWFASKKDCCLLVDLWELEQQHSVKLSSFLTLVWFSCCCYLFPFDVIS